MTIMEQIAEIKVKYPEAWAYIQEMLDYNRLEGEQKAYSSILPKFDDNDELIVESED